MQIIPELFVCLFVFGKVKENCARNDNYLKSRIVLAREAYHNDVISKNGLETVEIHILN